MTIQELERETNEEYSLDSIETTEELENIVRSMGIPIVSFYEFDINVAREVVEALGAILKKYPALKKTICAVGGADDIAFNMNVLNHENKKVEKENPQVIWNDYVDNDYFMQMCYRFNQALFPTYLSIAIIDKSKYSEIEEAIKISVSDGYNPPSVNSIKDFIYHEVGHILDFVLSIRTIISRMFKDNCTEIAKKISGYAARQQTEEGKIAEIIAEAFAEYTINPETTNEIIRMIGETIDKEYAFRENGPLFNINRDYGSNMKFPEEEEPAKKI